MTEITANFVSNRNQAKVDVAEARMKGEVGEADRKGKTKQEIAKIDAATAVLETERKAEKAAADAQLADKEIHIGKELKMSQISAQWAAEGRDAELQTVVQKKRAEMELERRRATEVTQAIIARESEQQKADAKQYTAEKVSRNLLRINDMTWALINMYLPTRLQRQHCTPPKKRLLVQRLENWQKLTRNTTI